MDRRGQLTLGLVVILVIGIITAIAMFPEIVDRQTQMTTKQTVSNDSIDVSSAYLTASNVSENVNFTIYSQSNWKKSSCPLTSVTLRNGAGTELTEDTDYTIYEGAGVFSLLNTTDTVPETALNLTYVDYTYCSDGYNTDSGSRSVAGLISIFAALAVLAFATMGIKNWIENR